MQFNQNDNQARCLISYIKNIVLPYHFIIIFMMLQKVGILISMVKIVMWKRLNNFI